MGESIKNLHSIYLLCCINMPDAWLSYNSKSIQSNPAPVYSRIVYLNLCYFFWYVEVKNLNNSWFTTCSSDCNDVFFFMHKCAVGFHWFAINFKTLGSIDYRDLLKEWNNNYINLHLDPWCKCISKTQMWGFQTWKEMDLSRVLKGWKLPEIWKGGFSLCSYIFFTKI